MFMKKMNSKLFCLLPLIYLQMEAALVEPPNIVMILVDDVGWNDFSYNSKNSLINTPNIDEISSQGVRFKRHYVQSVCTPTRASMLTGRYAANVGLVYAMVPGSPAGLPIDIPTLPQLLKTQGYQSKMVGKWHLGHSQWAQTPVGRGFSEHIGNYMWDLDSYTKQQYELPFSPLVVDWVHAYENGTYFHHAEPRHAIEAITQDAQDMLQSHSNTAEASNPLFLYVAYTAAHSPLQPLPRHLERCTHIPHIWRQQFCGMIMGLDEGIKNITDTIKSTIGENTLLYVFSDNGGSTWFGGSNVPLRGGKSTPHEGGVKVPAFMVDYTRDQRYLGVHGAIGGGRGAESQEKTVEGRSQAKGNKVQSQGRGREFYGMMHICDMLPTFLEFAGVTDINKKVSGLDGLSMVQAIRSGTNISPRTEMLLELYSSEDFVFDEDLMSYLDGDMKLIQGIVRDPFMYFESSLNRMNSSDTSHITFITEFALRALEWVFGAGRFDNTRIVITHRIAHMLLLQPQKKGKESTVRLYNLTADPSESTNIADQHPSIVKDLQNKVEKIKRNMVKQQKFWLQYDLESQWPQTFVRGDCSTNPGIKTKDCKFTHPWLPDDIDPWKDEATLVDSIAYVDMLGRRVIRFVVLCIVVFCILLSVVIEKLSKKSNKKKED